MNHAQCYLEQQETKQLHDRISSFLEVLKVGILLDGIRKLRGAEPLTVFTAIFALPLAGADFYRVIVPLQGG